MNVIEYAKYKKMFGNSGGSGGSEAVLIEKTVTENNTYEARNDGADGYSKVIVNIPAPEGDTLAEFLSWRGFNYLFYDCNKITEAPWLDTSNATEMTYVFHGCSKLTSVPLYDTSNVTTMRYMLRSCSKLTSVPLFDTSKVTNMSYMLNYCEALTTVPLYDTSKVTTMESMFGNCYALTTVPPLDMRNVTGTNSMFNSCKALTEIWVKNIKTNLQVGSGTSYGHLLTVDSLAHLIYELRKQSASRTLTVGSANLEKLADVYVKAIDITDEMRAEDDLIDEKYPFVRCESTDEGAMLITDYATTIKNWTIK